jgi:hypothetical protein
VHFNLFLSDAQNQSQGQRDEDPALFFALLCFYPGTSVSSDSHSKSVVTELLALQRKPIENFDVKIIVSPSPDLPITRSPDFDQCHQ